MVQVVTYLWSRQFFSVYRAIATATAVNVLTVQKENESLPYKTKVYMYKTGTLLSCGAC